MVTVAFVAGGCAVDGSTRRTPAAAARVARRPAVAGGSIRSLAVRAARARGLAPSLVLGVIAVESSFNPRARSHAGARGLMQLMPRTAASIARRIGWRDGDSYDPAFNIAAGTYYLAYLVKRFGEVDAALAAYNAGPVRIARLRRAGAPLPRYSLRYIAAVRRAQQQLSRGADGALPAGTAVATTHVTVAHDRGALRALLRAEYGRRPDEPLPNDR